MTYHRLLKNGFRTGKYDSDKCHCFSLGRGPTLQHATLLFTSVAMLEGMRKYLQIKTYKLSLSLPPSPVPKQIPNLLNK